MKLRKYLSTTAIKFIVHSSDQWIGLKQRTPIIIKSAKAAESAKAIKGAEPGSEGDIAREISKRTITPLHY